MLLLQLAGARRRNDFDGYVGAVIQAADAVEVQALGRYYGSGNGLGKHQVSIINPSTNATVATAIVDGTSHPVDDLGFVYASLATVAKLNPSQKYYLVSMEAQQGDYFFGGGLDNPQATTVASIALSASVYFFQNQWTEVGATGYMYGPLNMILQDSSS